MPRLSRIVLADTPHHVTQRGNRRQRLFLERGDYELYRDLLAERCRANAVACWAYCLMPNHVHLVLTPAAPERLARAVGEAHRRYTAFFNARARTTGHLFQGRFYSVAMDEPHLMAALRYVALNPVRAGLCARAQDWTWSSASAHLAGRDDALVSVAPALDRAPRFADLLQSDCTDEAMWGEIVARSAVGRPVGGADFLAAAETAMGRPLAAQKRGRHIRREKALSESRNSGAGRSFEASF